MSKLQKLSIREESLLHIDNTYTASFQGNAFSATSMPELLTRLRPAVENAAKAASVGFGMATKPNDGQQEAKQLLEAIDSQMIVGVVGRSDGKIECCRRESEGICAEANARFGIVAVFEQLPMENGRRSEGER